MEWHATLFLWMEVQRRGGAIWFPRSPDDPLPPVIPPLGQDCRAWPKTGAPTLLYMGARHHTRSPG